MKVIPKTNQIFYVLFDEESNMLHSITKENIFTTPFITKAMYFEGKAKAKDYMRVNNLNMAIVKVSPQYSID